VQYGRLVEPFRMAIAQSGVQRFSKLQRFALFHVLTQPRRLRLGLLPARVLQSAGLDRFLEIPWISKMVPESLGQMLALLPRLQGRQRGLSEMLTPHGKQRARVALFSGCVADGIFPETTRATARVLQWNGCEVWVPRRQGCCGALHFHAGDEEGARRLAVANARSFAQTFRRKKIDALIVNAAGCGAMLKDYGRLLEGTPAAADGAALASKAKDVSEFLMDLGPVPPRHPLPVRATYHDACHLAHAQKIRRQPRQLLEMIPGLELVPLDESEVCCGAAGTYSLTEPEMADRLGARKAERIIATGAKAVFAGNVGCLLQIGRHLKTQHADIWVGHPVDALAASYNGRDRTHR
jgi:glycolate oxidase iron-sulfur subunit